VSVVEGDRLQKGARFDSSSPRKGTPCEPTKKEPENKMDIQPTKQGGVMELKINGYDDRRKLVGILADNGYCVTVEERHNPNYTITTEFYVIVTQPKER